jgi:hypothetical protein
MAPICSSILTKPSVCDPIRDSVNHMAYLLDWSDVVTSLVTAAIVGSITWHNTKRKAAITRLTERFDDRLEELEKASEYWISAVCSHQSGAWEGSYEESISVMSERESVINAVVLKVEAFLPVHKQLELRSGMYRFKDATFGDYPPIRDANLADLDDRVRRARAAQSAFSSLLDRFRKGDFSLNWPD